jgi:hypothetical protein
MSAFSAEIRFLKVIREFSFRIGPLARTPRSRDSQVARPNPQQNHRRAPAER